jgi:hypothetical protein
MLRQRVCIAFVASLAVHLTASDAQAWGGLSLSWGGASTPGYGASYAGGASSQFGANYMPRDTWSSYGGVSQRFGANYMPRDTWSVDGGPYLSTMRSAYGDPYGSSGGNWTYGGGYGTSYDAGVYRRW